jgi:hypothetical protein
MELKSTSFCFFCFNLCCHDDVFNLNVEEEQVKMIRKVKTRVVFQSCISGETPMDWQIIITNNLDVKVEDSPTLPPSS